MKEKNFIILILFVTNLFYVNAQDTIVGVITNTYGCTVPYANIVCLGTTYGATTDSLGNFLMPVKSKNDQFKVSSIGYKSRTISAFELANDSVLIMESIITNIKSVDIIGDLKKSKNRTVGWPLRKRNYYMASLPGNQFATKIECPEGWRGSYIQNISFIIAKIGRSHSPIRLRILKVNSANMPGEDLLHKNIIVRNYSADTYETITVDLKTFGIKIPKNGAFISIEWLDVWDKSGSNIRSFYCTKDFIKGNCSSNKELPSPAIAMSRNKEPFSLQNYRGRRWNCMSSNCRINVAVRLLKIDD